MTEDERLLQNPQDDLAEWENISEQSAADEELKNALAAERSLAFESELEQDENPRDYTQELEDEEEAAPTSEKRLKRQIQAEALARLEDAARTEDDFRYIVGEWDRLDRNRERRERDHENLRGDVPLEYMAVPDPKIVPRWMNLPTFRQLCKGDFLDIIFSCPYEMHQLTANRFISELINSLSEKQKEVLYYLALKQYDLAFSIKSGATLNVYYLVDFDKQVMTRMNVTRVIDAVAFQHALLGFFVQVIKKIVSVRDKYWYA